MAQMTNILWYSMILLISVFMIQYLIHKGEIKSWEFLKALIGSLGCAILLMGIVWGIFNPFEAPPQNIDAGWDEYEEPIPGGVEDSGVSEYDFSLEDEQQLLERVNQTISIKANQR